MTKYFHIVQVHPVENGLPNLYKVELKRKFDTKEDAERWIKSYNAEEEKYGPEIEDKAVYQGRVNNETGELE